MQPRPIFTAREAAYFAEALRRAQALAGARVVAEKVFLPFAPRGRG